MEARIQRIIHLFTHPFVRLWVVCPLVYHVPVLNRFCQEVVQIFRDYFAEVDRTLLDHRRKLEHLGPANFRPDDFVGAYLMEQLRVRDHGDADEAELFR